MTLTSMMIRASGVAVILCSCANPSSQAHDPPPTPTIQLVGRIASVPADKRFVLIQIYGRNPLEPGSIVTSQANDGDADRSANLKVTGEALGQFAAADVQSGNPSVGDAVYSHTSPETPEPPKPEPPKPEPPKPEPPKPEQPKPEQPKPEAPKPEAGHGRD